MVFVESGLVVNQMEGVLVGIAQRRQVSQLAIRDRTNALKWSQARILAENIGSLLSVGTGRGERVPGGWRHREPFDFSSLDVGFGRHPGHIPATVRT